jgi:hypothetical protein
MIVVIDYKGRYIFLPDAAQKILFIGTDLGITLAAAAAR